MNNIGSSKGRRSRQLLAAVLTIVMLVALMPGMAFANDEVAAKTKSGVSAQEDPAAEKTAADYKDEVDALKSAYDGMSESFKTGTKGKEADVLLGQLNSSVQRLADAEEATSRLQEEVEKYKPGTVTLNPDPIFLKNEIWLHGYVYNVLVKCLIFCSVTGGGSEWTNELLSHDKGEGDWLSTVDPYRFNGFLRLDEGEEVEYGEADPYIADPYIFESKTIDISNPVPAGIISGSERTELIADATNKLNGSWIQKYLDLVDEENREKSFYKPSYNKAMDDAKNAKAANDAILASDGDVIKGIKSGITQLETILDEAIRQSKQDSINIIAAAAEAINKATEVIEATEGKGNLTDAQSDALEDYKAARDSASDAKEALEEALGAADAATTWEARAAAQQTIDEAREALEEALGILANKEAAHDTATKLQDLKDSIAAGNRMIADADNAIANAIVTVAEINVKPNLTDALRKARNKYIAARDAVVNAQSVLKRAITAAANTPNDITAAKDAIDEACEALEEALVNLTNEKVLLDAAAELHNSVVGGNNAIGEAGSVIDEATKKLEELTKAIEDLTKDKNNLLGALRKALDDYKAARDSAQKAQKALEEALAAAANATTQEEIDAAQKAVEKALKELKDALKELAKTQAALDATVELQNSTTAGDNESGDAGNAINDATNTIDETKAKDDLTDEQRKALEEYIAARDRALEAQKALEKALADAANAKTPAEAAAAQKAVDAARKALAEALANLANKEAALAAVLKPGKGGSPGNPLLQNTQTEGIPKVVNIRTPLKTVYLTKNTSYEIPYELDTVGGKTINDPGVKFTSSKAKIVKFVNSGTTYKVKALKTGKTVITIKAQNGKKAKIKVVVQKKKVALKKFKVKVPKKLKVGKTYQLKIKKLTKKASNISAITFKSSSKKIATVDTAGKITALKKGRVELTIKVGNKKLVKTITIK